MSDLISRSRLIEEIKRYQMDIVSKATAMKVIRNAPTVTDTNVGGKWIPCSERLPAQPGNNPVFESKPLELYLISVKNSDYPYRAFWNGKIFTDGFGKVDAIAWMPLPEAYKGEQHETD